MADHIRSIQEGLLVKSLFQHAESIKPQHASDHDAEKPEAVPWHQFLDELCHLCQFRRGGEDITAIAVERTKKGHRIFWIATNSGMKPESDARKIARKEHLAWILKTITAPRGWNVEMEKEDASELVFAEAIRKSPQRIKNYQHRLLSIVNEIDTQGDNSGRTGKALRTQLAIHANTHNESFSSG
ncbi:uncharacterized protein RCC_01223 [Ramularia collo-cygni]|uniref:Uncharacterized protein n=1 Tax=Ramularia collo-cygni TaxID=112498 RepID=A0A2D3US25_9PEZI|nr:uncharacterized protein RCC_01223 [Ramularia collo-cygni]CZT15360.1 uncharacterized protein RCC_01223 [Ramularia collo-cygni]